MSESTFFLVPAVAGCGLTLLLRTFLRRGGLYAALLGLAIAASFAVYGYSTAPRNDDWGPSVAFLLAGYAYMFWLVGVAVGACVAGVVAAARRGLRSRSLEA